MNIENKELENENRLEKDTGNNNADNTKIAENNENIIKQQQEQIDQLLKAQEVNKKIIDQLTVGLSQKIKETEIKNEEHWLDEKAKNFRYYAKEGGVDSEQIALWHAQMLKDAGKTKEEIASRFGKICEGIEHPELQVHESLEETKI